MRGKAAPRSAAGTHLEAEVGPTLSLRNSRGLGSERHNFMTAVSDLCDLFEHHSTEWCVRRRQVGTAELFGAVCARYAHRDTMRRSLASCARQLPAAVLPSLFSFSNLCFTVFPSVAAVGESARPRFGASAVSRALGRPPPAFFQSLHSKLYAEHVASRRSANESPGFAVDGSKVKLPPSLLRAGFRPQQRASKNPLALVTAIYDVRTGAIAAYDVSKSFDERGALLRLLAAAPLSRGSILLADRGFYSGLVWRRLASAGVHGVFRLRRNAEGAVKAFANAAQRRRQFVRLAGVPSDLVRWRAEPDGKLAAALPERRVAQLGHPRPGRDAGRRAEFAQGVHRDAGEDEWILATTADVTCEEAVRAYGTRWSIEVAFKVLKSGLGMGALAGRSEAAIVHAIEAICLLSLVVALSRRERAASRPPARLVAGCEPTAVPGEVRESTAGVLAAVGLAANATHYFGLSRGTADGGRLRRCRRRRPALRALACACELASRRLAELDGALRAELATRRPLLGRRPGPQHPTPAVGGNTPDPNLELPAIQAGQEAGRPHASGGCAAAKHALHLLPLLNQLTQGRLN